MGTKHFGKAQWRKARNKRKLEARHQSSRGERKRQTRELYNAKIAYENRKASDLETTHPYANRLRLVPTGEEMAAASALIAEEEKS